MSAVYTSGVLVNSLTKLDTAFLAKWNNTLTMYPSDAQSREEVVPARLVGIDEEQQEATYPGWRILAMPFVFDPRRFNEDRVVSVSGNQANVYGPPQHYLATYVVTGYAQDMRHFREMQMHAVLTFPRNAFITDSDGYDHYVISQPPVTNIDYDEKEYTLQLTYDVWLVVDLTTPTVSTLVFNSVVIGYTIGQGRTIKTDASEEEQTLDFS